MILFYETKAVLEDLKQKNLYDAYYRWRQRLEQFKRIDSFAFHLSRPGGNRLHEFGGENSIAVRLHTIDIDEKTTCDILELLRVFTRDFHGEQLEIQLEKLHSYLSDDELKPWAQKEAAKRLQKQQESVSPMEPLPSELLEWFNVGEWQSAGKRDPMDLTVYETKLWRKDVQGAIRHNLLAQIHTALSVFYLEEQDKVKTIRRDGNFYAVDIPGGWSILCNYRHETGERRELYLLGIFDPTSGVKKPEWLQKISKNYDDRESTLFPLPKSYPGLLLYEEEPQTVNGKVGTDGRFYEIWFETEKEGAKANLAMSGEEMAVLHELTAGALPTFINGPAGSGKSTILHYLFVHFWNHKIKKNLPQDLLFITLSKTLLGKAQEVVSEILRLEFSSENCQIPQEDKCLASSFGAFRDILKKIIGPDTSDYLPEHEIDFEAFKELFNNAPNNRSSRFPSRVYYRGQWHNRKITAELCWHIIRSYIKGYSVDGQITPEQFRQLRQNGVFVSPDDYRIVYEEVWPWYSRLTSPCGTENSSTRYWDQQDLARAALVKLTNFPLESWPEELRNIAAIFCDEAQDFTGVELKIVQTLSMLTRYDLSFQKQLPFAFAGDPMQSLNPSGFRWEDLQVSMYQNLVQENNSKCKVESKSLSLNYRSPRGITYLANLIQLVRGNIFNEPMQVQEPLSSDEGVPPILYIFEEGRVLSPEELSHLAGSIILLPCSAGHESDFIEDFPILKQIRSADANQVFMSVMTAKGLDIQKVIVFAFAEKLFSEPLRICPSRPSEDIALAYAFNQVYVAVTRATHQLLIMETPKGYENLWKVLDAKETKVRCLAAIRDGERRGKWESNLPRMTLATGLSNFKEMSPAEMRLQAANLKKDAMETRNAEKMGKAANFYSLAGQHDDEMLCWAYVYKFKKNFREAAERFKQYRGDATVRRAEIVDCLWQAEDWKGLCDMEHQSQRQQGQSFVDTDKLPIAQFMSASATPETVRIFVNSNSKLPLEAPWKKALQTLCDFALTQVTLSDDDKPIMASLADYLFQNRYAVSIAPKAVGHLWALLEEWPKMENLLPRENLAENDRLRMQAHSAQWPEYILACWKLRKQEGQKCFVKRWSEPRPIASLDEEQIRAVIQLLISNGMNQEALRFAEKQHYAPAWDFFESHDDFNSEMTFLRMVLNNPPARWGLCNKILHCVSQLLKQTDEMRRLLDLIADASSDLVNKISKDSNGNFERSLQDICKRHLSCFMNETDLVRAAATFEIFNLGTIFCELGETWEAQYQNVPPLREVAVKIYIRGRYIIAEYERKRIQTSGSRIQEESFKRIKTWGYDREQFDLLWKNASTKFSRPQCVPAMKGASVNMQPCADGSWRWEQAPLKGEVCENELVVHHQSNRRKCLFYLKKKDRQVFLGADDCALPLELNKTLSIPLADNPCEVTLALRESGDLEIKHHTWSTAKVFSWPD